MKYTKEDEDFSHINFLELSLCNLYEPEIHRSNDEVMYEEFIINKFKEELIKEPLETFIKNHLLIFQSLPSSDEILEVRVKYEVQLVPDDDEIRDQYFLLKQNN